MRRHHAALIVASAMLASPGFAATGLHLNWDRCIADGRVANRAFACDTNAGSEVLVFSYDPADEWTDRQGIEALVHIQSSSGVMPSWWQIQSGGCRAGAVLFDPLPGVETSCVDPYEEGLVSGGYAGFRADAIGPGSWVFGVGVAVPAQSVWTITPGNEYFAFRFVIRNVKTVAGCGGCDVPVCIGFGRANFSSTTDGVNMWAGETGPGGGESTVTWQGAYVNGYDSYRASPSSDYARLDCLHDDSSPARSSTWGAVKALYR